MQQKNWQHVERVAKHHSDFFNLLRAISAFIILITHACMIFLLPRYDLRSEIGYVLISYPQYAVMTLFIISGFFITYSVLQIIEKNTGSFSTSGFLFARLTRLYPALLFSIMLSIAVFFIFMHGNFTGTYHYIPAGRHASLLRTIHLDPKSYIASLLFLQGIFTHSEAPLANPPLWTLSYEFWLYLILMFITLFIVNKKKVLASLFLASLFCYLIIANKPRLIFFGVTWFSGAWLALNYHSKALFTSDFMVPIRFIAMLMLIVLVLLYRHYGPSIMISYPHIPNLTAEMLISLLCLCVFIGIIRKNYHFLHPAWRALINCSFFSYTLYLIHYPLLILAFRYTYAYLNFMPTYVILLACLAYAIIIALIAKQCAKFLENKHFFRRILSRPFTRKEAICETP